MSHYGYTNIFSGSKHRELRLGDKDSNSDDSVSKLMDLLSARGYKYDNGDRISTGATPYYQLVGASGQNNTFDSNLQKVLLRFQRDSNLPQSGKADYGTYRVLGVAHDDIDTSDKPYRASAWSAPSAPSSSYRVSDAATKDYLDSLGTRTGPSYLPPSVATPSSSGDLPEYLRPESASVDKSAAKGLLRPTAAQARAITAEIGPFKGTGNFRDVTGSGGWRYRQFKDGDVYVLFKPSGGDSLQPLPAKTTEPEREQTPPPEEDKTPWPLYIGLGVASLGLVGGIIWFVTRPQASAKPALANRKKNR